jgi:hypothetical protein
VDWHHNQQVHVAIRPRLATRSRAEQNDPLRIKALDNPQHHFVDNGFKPVFFMTYPQAAALTRHSQ